MIDMELELLHNVSKYDNDTLIRDKKTEKSFQLGPSDLKNQLFIIVIRKPSTSPINKLIETN